MHMNTGQQDEYSSSVSETTRLISRVQARRGEKSKQRQLCKQNAQQRLLLYSTVQHSWPVQSFQCAVHELRTS